MANRATVTYNNEIISTEDRDGNFAITYNDSTIATISTGATKILNCSGKLMETNVVIGGKTLNCAKKKMASNITVSVVSLFPSEPSSYNLIGTYTSSQTWTAPESGYFQIEAFGASGNGGNGFSFNRGSTTSTRRSGGGGGGGGGGYSCSRIKMNKGDTIALSVGAVGATTSAAINSSIESYSSLQVTGAENGTAASRPSIFVSEVIAGVGGAGGTASGGNYSNKNGNAGGNGSLTTGSAKASGGAGGAGANGAPNGGVGGKGSSANADLPGGTGSAGFIKIYRGNTNLSGGGNTSNNPVFYLQKIDGSQTLEFEFESGMTWSNFVASQYNDEIFTLDTTTQVQLVLEGQWAGATGTSLLAYNGFVIWLTNDTSTIEQGKFVSPEYNLDTLEAGRTYYCDGVGYVPPAEPDRTYIYKPGYTAFQNAVSSGANGSFSYSFSNSYISGRFGGALSAGHSLYIGIRMKDYSKIKIDFQNLSGGTTNIGYATSSTATTLSGQQTFSGSARTVAEIDISSVTTTSTRYLIFGGPSSNNSYRIYEISLE